MRCDCENALTGRSCSGCRRGKDVRLTAMRDAVHALAVSKGWWPEADRAARERAIPERLALCHAELSEALEAYRDAPAGSDLGEILRGADGKPDGFAVELADVVLRILDLAGGLGIDLAAAIEAKHSYNAGRPRRHGGKRC